MWDFFFFLGLSLFFFSPLCTWMNSEILNFPLLNPGDGSAFAGHIGVGGGETDVQKPSELQGHT